MKGTITLASAVVLALAAVLYWFFRVHSTVSYSVDFGSLADAIVFLAVGALIEYAYSKSSSDKQADTNLLLELVSEARMALRELGSKSENCSTRKPLSPAERNELFYSERELSNAVHSIEEALSYCKQDLTVLKFESLKRAREELKDALTDSPFPGPYDTVSISRIRALLKKMRDELTRTAFAINHR